MRGNHRPRLFQVNASIDAAEKHGIHFREQRCDVRNNLDAPLGADLFGVLIDARDAAFDIFAASFIGGHDAGAGNVILRARFAVEHLGEGGDVGGVRTDNAEADIGRSGELRDEEDCKTSLTREL